MLHRRRPWGSITAVALVVAVSSATAGEICIPPSNEVCAGATVFSNADLPYEVTAPLGCVNDIIDKPYFDVFYRFDCTRTGNYLVHMCGSTGDTYLRIYGDGCGWGYWFELGTWRPDPPWAPPLNSPYLFSVAFEAEPPGPSGSLDVDAGPLWQLQVAKDGADLALSWGPSCVLDDTDYAVYQGRLDVLGDHEPLACSTGGITSYTASQPGGDAYFLVTAHNGIVGGSYGTMSSGAQRSQGSPACLPRFWTQCP